MGMFGRRRWQAAEATIVDTHFKRTGSSGGTPEFVADVRPPDGEPFRTKLEEPIIATDFWAPRVGDVVRVQYDPKSAKVRFDKSDPKISAKAHEAAQDVEFDAELQEGPGETPRG